MTYGLDHKPKVTKDELELLRAATRMPDGEPVISCDCPYAKRSGVRFAHGQSYGSDSIGNARLSFAMVDGAKRSELFHAAVYELGCAVMQIYHVPSLKYCGNLGDARGLAATLVAKALVEPGVTGSGGGVKFGLIELYPYLNDTALINAFKDAGFTAVPFNGQHGSDLCLLYYTRHGLEKK